MAVDARQVHGVAARDAVEVRGGGKLLSRPIVLVPAPPEQPLPRLEGTDALGDPPTRLIQRGRAHQIEGLERGAQGLDVNVRVGQARDHRPAGQVDPLRGGPDEGLDLCLVPDRDDAAIAYRDGAPPRPRRIQRDDHTAGEDQVGRLLGGGDRRRQHHGEGEGLDGHLYRLPP